jgi:hypothetical protein
MGKSYYVDRYGVGHIPDGNTIIKKNAFKNNAYLKKIVIPANVEIIGEFAFANCQNLESVIFITDNLIEIKDHAFYGCKKIETIDLPEGLEYIRPCAFFDCTSLQMVHLPSSLIQISGYAFSSCKALYFVAFNDETTASLKRINKAAFSHTNLLDMVLPRSIEYLENDIFNGCPIMHIQMYKPLTSFGFDAFDGIDNSVVKVLK